MSHHPVQVTLEEETDPVERAKALRRRERFERNWAWLEAHASEVYRHRGKYLCIAGEQLFAGDSVGEVVAQARATCPEDDGWFTRYIPKEKVDRVYAY